MKHLNKKEHRVVQRIKTKWRDTCDGLMHITGSMRPLLMLEFQGHLDYLKVVEKQISFWEMKTLEVDHRVGPCNFDNRIIMLNATSNIEIFIPGRIGNIPLYLTYSSENEKHKTLERWEAIMSDIEEQHDD